MRGVGVGARSIGSSNGTRAASLAANGQDCDGGCLHVSRTVTDAAAGLVRSATHHPGSAAAGRLPAATPAPSRPARLHRWPSQRAAAEPAPLAARRHEGATTSLERRACGVCVRRRAPHWVVTWSFQKHNRHAHLRSRPSPHLLHSSRPRNRPCRLGRRRRARQLGVQQLHLVLRAFWGASARRARGMDWGGAPARRVPPGHALRV